MMKYFILIITYIICTAQLLSKEFYVSTDGDNKNNGSIDSPFATIEHARDAIRKLIPNMNEDITIYIRSGNYYLERPILLTPKDSGQNGYTVFYKGYKNEVPKIYGGKKVISKWSEYKDGIFKTKVNKEVSFWSLLVNEKLAKRAYSNLKQEAPNKLSIENLQAYYQGGWMSEYIKINGFDKTGAPILAYRKSKFTGRTPKLIGDKSFIKNPGEWAINSNEGYLYLKPKSKQDLNNVIIPRCKSIFSIKGTESEKTKNIEISNLELILTDFNSSMRAYSGIVEDNGYEYSSVDQPQTIRTALISIENAKNIKIKETNLHEAPINAISIYGASENNSIYGCKIHNIGYNGIYIAGYKMGKDSVNNNKKNNIINNEIFNILETVNHGSGILIYQSSENIISNNMIHNSRRYAISLKGQRYGCLKKIGLTPKFEEQWNYIFTNKNTISYNYLYDLGNDSKDGGGIETWGGGRDNVADHNIIVNAYSSGPRKGKRGHGIFLDDGSNYWTITNNIIYNTHTPSLNTSMSIAGKNMLVINNVMDITEVREGGPNLLSYVEPSSNQIFSKNIIYSSNTKSIAPNGVPTNDEIKQKIVISANPVNIVENSDYNLFAILHGEPVVQVNRKRKKYSRRQEIIPMTEWGKIDNKGFDRNSVIIKDNPGFKNIKERDYRLKYNSPAINQLEIKSIDMVSIGLLPDYKFSKQSDTLKMVSLKVNNIDSSTKMKNNEVIDLQVYGRTKGWFCADLSSAKINFTITPPEGMSHSSTAVGKGIILPNGRFQATATGVVVITANITLNGVTKSDSIAITIE
jgi:parallel beta-helix repeat protein